ncbi:MAG TPA: hypothetical protein VFZ61_16410 [Polyangiales bacterium]
MSGKLLLPALLVASLALGYAIGGVGQSAAVRAELAPGAKLAPSAASHTP